MDPTGTGLDGHPYLTTPGCGDYILFSKDGQPAVGSAATRPPEMKNRPAGAGREIVQCDSLWGYLPVNTTVAGAAGTGVARLVRLFARATPWKKRGSRNLAGSRIFGN